VLETLFFADEVRDPRAEIGYLPSRVKLSQQETRMARQLVNSMSGPWTPSDDRDTYTDRVNDLIEAKKSEKELQPAAEPPAATNVADLTEALQASVEAAKKAQGKKPTGKSKPGKAASASKPARRRQPKDRWKEDIGEECDNQSDAPEASCVDLHRSAKGALARLRRQPAKDLTGTRPARCGCGLWHAG
jgi:hypothetical protein